MQAKLLVLVSVLIGTYGTVCSAQPSSTDQQPLEEEVSCYKDTTCHVNGPVEARVIQENKMPLNYIGIAFYKPTYILPYYYTGSPDNGPYLNNTPDNEKIRSSEVKFQLSLKVPVWKNMFDSISSLYFAYTQLSYWQAYSRKPFFRETDYEPEAFVANEVNWHLFKNWHLNFLNVGAVHQSNGSGDSLERSWNRIYVEAISSNDNWMVSIKPWYIATANGQNSNIGDFMGYGEIVVSYKFDKQVFAIRAHTIIENPRRATAEVTWSFPITPYLKGYAQFFSGYGQSLIEYNHRTNSGGIGVAFSDWA